MANEPLGAVVEFLDRIRSAKAYTDSSDSELVKRFLADKDEKAFITLLKRHGPMVLRVGRGVLGSDNDVDDIFQATFLLLARKAKSIRKHQSVASWLYGVANRLALNMKRREATRQAHERQAADMGKKPQVSDEAWQELQTALHEALAQLPEKYRAALLICYLEGKTQPEAAQHLGCPLGTIRSRLARGRDQLQKLLQKRGLPLSATALAAAFGANTASAAVKFSLVQTTAKAALEYASGQAATALVSAQAATLVEEGLKTMTLVKLKTATALVLCIAVFGVGVGAVGVAGHTAWPHNGQPFLAHKPQASAINVGKSANEQKAPNPATKQQAAETGKMAPVRLSASGQVLDERGKPIQGATVYLREIAVLRNSAALQQEGYTDILAQTTTDATGRFSFKDIAVAPMEISPSNYYRFPWDLVVVSPGRGLAWQAFKSLSDDDVALVMSPEMQLRGRLLESDGKPAKNVRVQLNRVNDQLDPDPRKARVSPTDLQLWSSQLPLATVTDTDGRFVLKGLPKGFHIGLMAIDPRFARTYLSAATLDKAQIERLNAPPTVPAKSKLLPDGFTATLEPSRSIRGQVNDGDTGKPVAGARVSMGIFQALTDSAGRYSFVECNSGQFNLSVAPPEGTDYLRATAEVAIPAEKLVQQQDFTLRRGSIITGHLREKASGQPLRVPYVNIQYRSEDPKGFSDSARSKADGSFRIVVPPGKGKLFTYDSIPGCVPLDLPSDKSDKDVWRPVDVKPGETLTGQDLLFSRGMTVEGRVLDSDSKPVAGAVFHGTTEQPRSGADGTFTLSGLSQQYRSHFLVLHAQRGIGAKIIIEPSKDTKPVVMDAKLQPTQSLKGRVLDKDNQPIVNASVSLLANITLRESGDRFAIRPLSVCGPVRTDAAGTFTLPSLVVDGSYTVEAAAPDYAPVAAHFRVAAGKNPELADLVLLRNNLVLGGVVVNQAGNPVEGVHVTIQPLNKALANNHDFMNTKKDGRFYFGGLPAGTYRLLAMLLKPTGAVNKTGQPVNEAVASVDIRVEAGADNLRIVLEAAKDTR